jgi:hypothetical protein
LKAKVMEVGVVDFRLRVVGVFGEVSNRSFTILECCGVVSTTIVSLGTSSVTNR